MSTPVVFLDGPTPSALGWEDMPIEMLVTALSDGHPEAMVEAKRRMGSGIEEKSVIRRVRDVAYWGLPYNTIITPGMKPVGYPSETFNYWKDTESGSEKRPSVHEHLSVTRAGRGQWDWSVEILESAFGQHGVVSGRSTTRDRAKNDSVDAYIRLVQDQIAAMEKRPKTKPVPPRPVFPDLSGLEGEEFDSAFNKSNALERAWKRDIKTGLSLGTYSYDDAVAAGWYGNNERWEPLPDKPLFHVTTAKSKVLADGLKTRAEIGGTAAGLGGGEEDTISLTDDPEIAEIISDGIKDMQEFLSGERSYQSLVDEATRPTQANRPFLKDFLQSLSSAIGQAGIDRFASGDDTLQDRYHAFQTFLFWREQAGGPMDPLFFGTDPEALVKIDPDEIGIIEVKPKPGAQGYRMGALGEWRTGTGKALDVVQRGLSGDSAPLPDDMEKSIEAHRQELDYLLHTYDAVSSGDGKGKRRPLVPGGSRWGHGGVYLSQNLLPGDKKHDIDVFEGPFDIYVVDDDENGSGTIWDGGGTDKEWNDLLDEIARRAGYEDNFNVMHIGPIGSPDQHTMRPWDDRQPFFAEVRKTLESRGFDGVQVGGEIVVWNYDKLKPTGDNEVRSMFGLPKWRGGAVSAAEEPDEDYRMAHRPSGPEFGAPASDVTFGIYPKDFYSHPEYYRTGDNRADAESLAVLHNVRGRPNAIVTVYRSSPKGTRINPGDWVSLSRSYARGEGLARNPGEEDLPVHQRKVRAGDIFTSGDSINEFGWFPGAEPRDMVGLTREWPTEDPHPTTGYRMPKSDVTMADGRTIHVESGGDAVPGGYNGWFALYDNATGKKLGYIDYQSTPDPEDSVLVAMIEVEPKARRQGIAEVLVARLMAEFPGRSLSAGLTTEEGGAFWKSISKKLGWNDYTNDPTFIEIVNRAEEIGKLDDLRRQPTADRKGWENNSQGDFSLAEIGKIRGFDAKPTVVSKDEFDRLSKEPGYIPIYRGLAAFDVNLPPSDPNNNGEGFARNLREGEFYYGTGAAGNGMYASGRAKVAAGYARFYSDGFKKGVLVPMLIKPDANLITAAELRDLQNDYFRSLGYKDANDAWGGYHRGDWPAFIAEDPGRFAAMLGYDGIVDNEGYGDERERYIYVILNRGVLVIRDTNMTQEEVG